VNPTASPTIDLNSFKTIEGLRTSGLPSPRSGTRRAGKKYFFKTEAYLKLWWDGWDLTKWLTTDGFKSFAEQRGRSEFQNGT